MLTPPHSVEDERAVLGAIMLSDAILPALTVDVGLKPEHFYRPKYAAVLRAMLAVQGHGERVDVLTVGAELRRVGEEADEREIDTLAAYVPGAGNALAYARRVVELAELRQKATAAYGILDAVAKEDRLALAEAEGQLLVERPRRVEVGPEELAEELVKYVEGGGRTAYPTPFADLTHIMAGGFTAGTTTVLGGHSSHGKSALAGMICDTVARELQRLGEGPLKVYIAEGSPRNWGLRYVARSARVNYGRLVSGKLRDGDHGKFMRAANEWTKLGIVLVAAHGWTPEEVVADVRRSRPKFWAVDLLNELNVGRGETNDWDRAVRELTAAPEITDSHLLLLAHVNEARAVGKAVRPKPTLGDLRSTGMLKNAADTVMFVYREQSEDGTELKDEGEVYVAKARDGRLGTVEVTFQGQYQRFLPVDEIHA